MEIEVTALKVGGERIGTVHHMYGFDPFKFYSTDTLVHTMVSLCHPIPGHGYAGFESPRLLEQYLRHSTGLNRYDTTTRQNLAAAIYELGLADVTGIVSESVERSYNALPTEKLHVYVFPAGDSEEADSETKAITARGHVVHFYVRAQDNLKEQFMSSMPHEYGHSARFEKRPEDTFNLLSSIVHEGIAENFSEEVLGKTYQWIKNTTYKELYEAWKHTRPLLDSTDHQVLRNAVDFSGENTGIAYKLGFYIVRWALQRTGQRVKDIIHLPDEEIVRMSMFPL